MSILPEDRLKYNDFILEQIKELGCLAYDREAIVWHYTTGPGFVGIVESGSLYATQVACLNDSTEIRYALKLYRDALTELREKNAQDTDAQEFLSQVIAMSSDDPSSPSHGPSRFFVTCFSSVEDDLNQWRAYSPLGARTGMLSVFGRRV
jgi:hypothetical protein